MDLNSKTLALIIGHRMRSKRIQLGLSQSQLANAICSQTGISVFENGTEMPAPETLELLAKRLQDDLLWNYAKRIRSGLTDNTTNEEDLLLFFSAFKNQKGRITSQQFFVALSLIDTLYRKGMFDEVMCLTKRIINQYQKNGNDLDHVYFRSCFYYGSSLLFQFQFLEGIEWLKFSYQGNEQLDNMLQARICYNLGYAYNGIRAYGKALWYAHKAEHIFKDLNVYPRQGKALALIGAIQGQFGMHDESIESLFAGISLLEKWNANEVDIIWSYCCLADQYLALKETQSAAKYCERILQSKEIVESDCTLSSSVQRILSIIAYLNSDLEEALYHYSLSWDAAQASSDQWTIVRTALLGMLLLPAEQEKLCMADIITESELNLPTCIEHGLAYKYLAKNSKKNKKSHLAAKYSEKMSISFELNIASHSDMSIYLDISV